MSGGDALYCRAAFTPHGNQLHQSDPLPSIDAEYVVGGHSHTWAMGAPRGYQGPRGAVPAPANAGRRGYFFVEQDAKVCTPDYWPAFTAFCAHKDAIIAWNGNQHYVRYLFEVDGAFDFLANVPGGKEIGKDCRIVPQRLVRAWCGPTISDLHDILANLIAAKAHSITLVGTPPPPADYSRFEMMIRCGWGEIAAQNGVRIEEARLTSPVVLLKLWSVVQEMLREAAATVGARFVPVPQAVLTSDGFLNPIYGLEQDFTHANDDFGRIMLHLALTA